MDKKMRMISNAHGFHMFAYAITTLTLRATPRTTLPEPSCPAFNPPHGTSD